MPDLRPANALVFGPFELPAFITPPGEAQIETVIAWLAPTTARVRASTSEAAEPWEDQRPRVAVRRDQVAALPVGTEILTTRPPELPDPYGFIVDAVEDLDPDVFYARVH